MPLRPAAFVWAVCSVAAWIAMFASGAGAGGRIFHLDPWLHDALLALVLGAPPGAAALVAIHFQQLRRLERSHLHKQAAQMQAELAVLDMVPVPIAVSRGDPARARINRAMAELMGVERIGSGEQPWDWSRFMAESDWAAWQEAVVAARSSGQPQWVDATIRSRDDPLEVLVQVAPLPTGGAAGGAAGSVAGGGLAIVLRRAEDAMAQRATQQLRELLQATESEKWLFGQAVHDELGQRLSGIAYFSKTLQRKLEAASRPEADDAAWLTDMANDSMSVARGLARGLVPVGTDDPGALATMLNEQCQTSSKMFDVDCTLFADDDFNPGGAARANHLYHAVQELITNAIKHGQATRVQVHLEVHDDKQTLCVEDNGRGMLASPPSSRPGMGLNGVRSRVAHLGGQFSLVEATGGGTRALIELPGGPAIAETTGPTELPATESAGADPKAVAKVREV